MARWHISTARRPRPKPCIYVPGVRDRKRAGDGGGKFAFEVPQATREGRLARERGSPASSWDTRGLALHAWDARARASFGRPLVAPAGARAGVLNDAGVPQL